MTQVFNIYCDESCDREHDRPKGHGRAPFNLNQRDYELREDVGPIT